MASPLPPAFGGAGVDVDPAGRAVCRCRIPSDAPGVRQQGLGVGGKGLHGYTGHPDICRPAVAVLAVCRTPCFPIICGGPVAAGDGHRLAKVVPDALQHLHKPGVDKHRITAVPAGKLPEAEIGTEPPAAVPGKGVGLQHEDAPPFLFPASDRKIVKGAAAAGGKGAGGLSLRGKVPVCRPHPRKGHRIAGVGKRGRQPHRGSVCGGSAPAQLHPVAAPHKAGAGGGGDAGGGVPVDAVQLFLVVAAQKTGGALGGDGVTVGLDGVHLPGTGNDLLRLLGGVLGTLCPCLRRVGVLQYLRHELLVQGGGGVRGNVIGGQGGVGVVAAGAAVGGVAGAVEGGNHPLSAGAAGKAAVHHHGALGTEGHCSGGAAVPPAQVEGDGALLPRRGQGEAEGVHPFSVLPAQMETVGLCFKLGASAQPGNDLDFHGITFLSVFCLIVPPAVQRG